MNLKEKVSYTVALGLRELGYKGVGKDFYNKKGELQFNANETNSDDFSEGCCISTTVAEGLSFLFLKYGMLYAIDSRCEAIVYIDNLGADNKIKMRVVGKDPVHRDELCWDSMLNVARIKGSYYQTQEKIRDLKVESHKIKMSLLALCKHEH